MKITSAYTELIWATPDALKVIESAGRVCYKSEGLINEDSAALFVKKILANGHEAVIEHAMASLRIICDRGVSHEIVRHRIASYCQESTRYCNYGSGKFGEEITVIQPVNLSPAAENIWKSACEHAEKAYLNMLKEGASPQEARAVLPTCLKTELIMTANFREWRHFLRLRLAAGAHPDMRVTAKQIQNILIEVCPVVFESLD